MHMARSFKDLFAKARKTADYWAELATLDFTAALDQRMRELNVTRGELAERIGTSPAYVTKVLNGRTNFTVRTMASLAHALGQRVNVQLEDEGEAEELAPAHATVFSAIPRRARLVLVRNRVEFDATNESHFSKVADAA
jgi:transcriptional regulator with XRE-family HTH domain